MTTLTPQRPGLQNMFLVLAVTVIVPASLVCWLLRLIFGLGPYHPDEDSANVMTPLRLLISILLPIVMAYRGYYLNKSLSLSGAWTALVVGFILTLSNYCFISAMMAFFLVASKATRLRKAKKMLLEADYREGGQRNWVQVICNGGAATELAVVYLMDVGTKEIPIDFSQWYTASWLCMAVLGAVATSCGDTLASEIGSVFAWSQPRLVTSLARVPTGTNGGITFTGLVSSLVGGAIVGGAFYATLLVSVSADQLGLAPAQWPILLMGALSGLLGSLVDSILGATLQYSGYDRKRHRVVERRGSEVDHISGFPLLDNHCVNLLSSIIMALLTPRLALRVWSMVQ